MTIPIAAAPPRRRSPLLLPLLLLLLLGIVRRNPCVVNARTWLNFSTSPSDRSSARRSARSRNSGKSKRTIKRTLVKIRECDVMLSGKAFTYTPSEPREHAPQMVSGRFPCRASAPFMLGDSSGKVNSLSRGADTLQSRSSFILVGFYFLRCTEPGCYRNSRWLSHENNLADELSSSAQTWRGVRCAIARGF